MKELSIEEKTYNGNYKVYIELINRLEDVKEAIKKQNYGIAMDILCKSYPEFQITTSTELAESEGEKIRKWLIAYLENVIMNTSIIDEKDNCLNAIKWLEKQGGSIKEYNVCDTCDEQAGCVNPCPMKLIGQKPITWSEEDENFSSCVLAFLKDYLSEDGYKEYKTWIKSIKDRVQPQQKQEWSEEDEEMYKEVLTDIIYAKNDLKAKECFGLSKRAAKAFNWFSKRYKSLRPQNMWKPSIAQLNALSIVSKGNAPDDIEAIVSLYNDLKKLREE